MIQDKFYAATDLRALRAKIGISQSDLAVKCDISRITIARYEKSGTSNARYVASLLAIIEAGNPITPTRLGRPPKSWRLLSLPKSGTYAGVARYWLWRPEHAEHFSAIAEPPTGIGDSWLVRGDEDDTRYRYERKPDGSACYVETIRDYAALVRATSQKRD